MQRQLTSTVTHNLMKLVRSLNHHVKVNPSVLYVLYTFSIAFAYAAVRISKPKLYLCAVLITACAGILF